MGRILTFAVETGLIFFREYLLCLTPPQHSQPPSTAAPLEVSLSLPVKLVNHRSVPVASHHHLLLFELLGNLQKTWFYETAGVFYSHLLFSQSNN